MHHLLNLIKITAHKQINPNHILHFLLHRFSIPFILLVLAGIFLLKAVAHPTRRGRSFIYGFWSILAAILFLTSHEIWLLPAMLLYKLWPLMLHMRRRKIHSTPIRASHHRQFISQEESLSLHYYHLTSYYSYDEQPQALYPPVLPPQ